jgi:hypothetical protein
MDLLMLALNPPLFLQATACTSTCIGYPEIAYLLELQPGWVFLQHFKQVFLHVLKDEILSRCQHSAQLG